MSNNVTNITNNVTNITTIKFYYSYEEHVYYYTYYALEIFLMVTGTLLNVWFLVAILLSPSTRLHLRNKMICNNLILNLLDSAVLMPVSMWISLTDNFISCTLYSALANLRLIQDFTSNWLVIMLIVVFIAQIEDFNPRMKLTPRVVTIATIGLLILPWVASLLVVPIIVHEFYFRLKYARAGCLYPTRDAAAVIRKIDTATPIFLMIILVIVAAVLKYRRFNRGNSSSSMQVELISRGPEIDNTVAYAAAVAASILCDFLRLIFSLNLHTLIKPEILIWFYLPIASSFMSDVRVILMPLTWLFLTDIRQRIRTWRPWKRDTVIDLTITYRKESI